MSGSLALARSFDELRTGGTPNQLVAVLGCASKIRSQAADIASKSIGRIIDA